MQDKKEVCGKCKGQGIVEVFEPEVGFEVLIPCPECDIKIENSLREILDN
ncbi:MAG: hypothetical protein HZC52_04425 [Planctomycetes bacterium]|nr:hypothetical protein [Planctomycetota bacterium]